MKCNVQESVSSFADLVEKEPIERLFKERRGVFPELPQPVQHLFVKPRNLNSEDAPLGTNKQDIWTSDMKPVPAVEVGVKFSF